MDLIRAVSIVIRNHMYVHGKMSILNFSLGSKIINNELYDIQDIT